MEQIKVTIVGKMELLKPKPAKVVKTYPQEEIHFFKARDGKTLGRVSSGKIAIISFDYKGKWVSDGDDWLCNVIHEDENKVIVWPVNMTMSAEDNFINTCRAAASLQEKGYKLSHI